jgi:hypothetical protein
MLSASALSVSLLLFVPGRFRAVDREIPPESDSFMSENAGEGSLVTGREGLLIDGCGAEALG